MLHLSLVLMKRCIEVSHYHRHSVNACDNALFDN